MRPGVKSIGLTEQHRTHLGDLLLEGFLRSRPTPDLRFMMIQMLDDRAVIGEWFELRCSAQSFPPE
jgi:hypothetical protein